MNISRTGLPNSTLNIVGPMGITCGCKTGRAIIKSAGINSNSLILKVVAFGEAEHGTKEILDFLDELSQEPYLYIGRNKMPHRIIYNG